VSFPGDEGGRLAFLRDLLRTRVYVLGSVEGEMEGGRARSGSRLRVFELEDGAGRLVPAFTSEDMVQATLAAHPDAEPHYLVIPFKGLVEVTRAPRYVLDPQGPHPLVLSGADVQAALAGGPRSRRTEVVEDERRVRIGQARYLPPGLLRALCRLFSACPVVEAAHLGWISDHDGQEGFLMVVVAADGDKALAGLEALDLPALTGGPTLDVVVVPPDQPDHLLSRFPPFYRR
jgi:hypothetical protein